MICRLGVVGLALAIGATVIGISVMLQLTHGGDREAGAADAEPRAFLFETPRSGGRVCQDGGIAYRGTGALRVTIGTHGRPGAALRVVARGPRGHVIARGRLSWGWKEGIVRIPLTVRPTTTTTGVRWCFFARPGARLAWAGESDDPSSSVLVQGKPTAGRLSIISLLPGRPSLLDIADKLLTRYGAGNASWFGGWMLVLVPVLLLAAFALGALALLSSSQPQPWRRIPMAARWCAVAAILTATAWALLIPPFQVPDENAHFSYVAQLIENGTLPKPPVAGEEPYSRQEQDTLAALRFYDVIGRVHDKPPWSRHEAEGLRDVGRENLSRKTTTANTASANPPLYYLLSAPVYAATRGTTVLDQLLPLRLVSALLAGMTVLAVFLFARELLPRSPWTWTAGALAVGFQPLFGFMSGGFNPDALLYACGAVTLLAMARLLRHGLTTRRAGLLAVAVAAGVLTKPLFLGLVPAAAACVVVVLIRQWRRSGKGPLFRPAVVALLIILVPVLGYQILGSTFFNHGYFQRGVSVGNLTQGVVARGGGLNFEVSYVWQLFLPRLPFMNELFPPPNTLPLRFIWFDGFIGRFGAQDYGFADWVNGIAVWIAVALVAASAATLVVRRDSMRGRWIELGCYSLALLGLVLLVGHRQFAVFVAKVGDPFFQTRYFLPIVALYGGLVAMAVRLFGRRIGPVLGVTVVSLAVLHTASSMILTVVRYYA